MPQTRIEGKFYPLQESELIDLKEKKLINNTAYVHFALKIENPFCDRAIEIHPKQFALRWKLPEVSVYKAIAKLKKLNLINIKSGKLVISWIIGSDNAQNQDSVEDVEVVAVNDSPHNKEVINEKLSDPIEDYQKRESIIKFDNELSDPRIDYQKRKNRGLKALADIAPACLQTIQNFQKIQTNQKEVEQNNSFKEELNQERKLIKLNHQATQNESNQENPKEIHKDTTKVKKKKVVPARVVRKISKMPDELKERLETLGIPLDKQILDAISEYDISQAYGAAAHVEDTWETITNPRGVFLFQLPKQKIEQLGARLPEIGSKMRKENADIEKEMESQKYQEVRGAGLAKIREILNQIGGKKNERTDSP